MIKVRMHGVPEGAGYHHSTDSGGLRYVDVKVSLLCPQFPSPKMAEWGPFSIRETIPELLSTNLRCQGIYQFGEAEATITTEAVSRSNEGRELAQVIEVNSPDLASLVELYRRIRAGTITPVESWEKEQIVSSSRELRDLWREMWRLVGRNIRDWIRSKRVAFSRRFTRRPKLV